MTLGIFSARRSASSRQRTAAARSPRLSQASPLSSSTSSGSCSTEYSLERASSASHSSGVASRVASSTALKMTSSEGLNSAPLCFSVRRISVSSARVFSSCPV